MPITKIPLTNIYLTIHGGRYCIGCEQGEFRFHIWLDPETLKPENHLIFKNPIAFTPRLQVRRLSLAKGNGKAIGDELLPHAARLLPGALEASKDVEQAEHSKHEAALAIHRAKEAGPELLEALQELLKHFTKTPGTLVDTAARGKAHSAIAKATGAAA